MLKEFFNYLEAQIQNGSIYVLGAIGQTGAQITKPWIMMREHYNIINYTNAIKLWQERLAQGLYPCAYDCNGLGNKFFLDNKLYESRTNANGLYGHCQKITRDQVKPGDWAFRVTLGRAHHIGYVAEGLVVYESMGRKYGVVKRNIDVLTSKGTAYWDRFGRPDIFKTEIENEIEKGGEEMLKRGDKGEAVKSLQTKLKALGYDLGTFGVNKDGIDGDFGGATETAVKAVQKTSGLIESGAVDYFTLSAIDAALCEKQTQGYKSACAAVKSIINGLGC